MKTATYFSILIVLIVFAFLLSNCGGGSDSGAIPDVASPQQIQNLINTDVKGYIFHKTSISSSETGEKDNDFPVIEIPMTGDEGFLNQVTEYFQDTSSRANTEGSEELLKTFTDEASLYQPLTSWQPSAQIFGIYDETPITLNGDGSFAGTVSADESENTVGLEILIPEGEAYEVETIAASAEVTSSDNTGVTLKSCPQKIIIKPGQCEIFKVFAKPSINLYESGLQFSLANLEIGCLAGPIFIKCGGQKKNSIAYGILYVKKNVDTPLDTSINVTDTQGRSLSIPVQVVRKTASVSGKVYTGGVPLVKGNVKSIGPKSFCRLDSEGNYVLPKTFMGSGRKVIATWWTLEGGKQVKHREVKYVDLYGDMTGVNFGVVPPEPTPTMRPPGDHFYFSQISLVTLEFEQWREQLGTQLAVERAVDWLNKNLPSAPPVPEGIRKAYIDNSSEISFSVLFEDGMCISIDPGLPDEEINSSDNQNNWGKQVYNDKISVPGPVTGSEINPLVSSNILILSPFEWHIVEKDLPTVANTIVPILYPEYGEFDAYLKAVVTEPNDFDIDLDHPYSDPTIYHPYAKVYPLVKRPSATWEEDIVSIEDFLNLNRYGVIFIKTHGWHDNICIPYFEGDDRTERWLETHTDPKFVYSEDNEAGIWQYSAKCFSPLSKFFPDADYSLDIAYIPMITLRDNFFKQEYNQPDSFSGSMIYLSSCRSARLYDSFKGAAIYLGYDCKNDYDPEANKELGKIEEKWTSTFETYFFLYMINGPVAPEGEEIAWNTDKEPYPNFGPVHAKKAFDILTDYYEANFDCWLGTPFTVLKIFPEDPDEIYFPAPGIIEVE